MSDINLLPQKSKKFLSEERLLLGFKIVAVTLVILVVSLSILFFLLSRDGTILAVKNDESRTIAQLTLVQSKTAKYLIIVDRINKIKTLTKKRLSFDTTITTLTQQIPKGVTITSFSLDTKELSLAISTRDLTAIGLLIDNFTQLIGEKKILKTLTIQGLVSDERNGAFILTLTGGLL
ncbi:MAG TPA: hypothetical protein VEW42_05145 [Candidatus Eisenbacteria bacterium]|nr:hypothetical protein [Candidatus Eisenbacteria bacterium]